MISVEEYEREESLERIGNHDFPRINRSGRLKASWLVINRISEGSDWECGPPLIGRGEDRSPYCRPQFCSSVPSLSPIPSFLGILHEKPPEQGPITLEPDRAHLAARLPRKGPSAFLFSILFLFLILCTDSAISHPVVC